MNLRVSTKMESAWYVDPDLLAGDDEAERPARLEVDPDGPPPRDATQVLCEADLEELAAAVLAADEGERRYREVALRGAIMALDEAGARPPAGARLREALEGGLARLRATGLPAVPPALAGRLRRAAARTAAGAAALFEPGRVPPVALAAGAFVAGVGTTLVGVLLAL